MTSDRRAPHAFRKWLKCQEGRDDAVGALARTVDEFRAEHPPVSSWGTTWAKWLRDRGASDETVDVCLQANREWKLRTRGP